MNVPKDWSAPHDGEKDPYHISLANNGDQNTLDITDKGSVEILDPKTFALRFVPAFGFRGSLMFWLYALDDKGALKSSVEVKIDVGNSLNHFQPALAVRGSGCVMCHADVRSNVVTDMGFGSGYFFGKNVSTPGYFWNFGSIYGDFEAFDEGKPGNWAQIGLVSGRQVFVPKNASIPVQDAVNQSGATTLKSYLQQRFAASGSSGTRGAIVTEKNTIYIGAPTANRIRQAFNYNSGMGRFVYEKDSAAGALDLAGLRDAGSYLTNDGTLVCDGDLMIEGTLMLRNLKVRTHNGCRLYVTRSVYIYGAIEFENVANSDLRNLQITSARAIMMGLGKMYNSAGQHCEQNAPVEHRWYWDRLQNIDSEYNLADRADYLKSIKDSAYNRFVRFWPNIYHHTRDGRAPSTVNTELYNEYLSTVGDQYDAACSGRQVAFSRLLLNAPRVESRYNGNFSGSIVAEISIMALGQFNFEFDPVFSEAAILPKLSDADYLKIE